MIPLNKKKLIWSALAVVMLTTPALAQRQHRPVQSPGSANTLSERSVPHYPNGGDGNGAGTARSREPGAEFNLGR